MTRVLDDCLEISIARYPQEENRTIMRMKRKIGIGVCGLADFLIKLRIPYASDRARVLAQDVVTFINYISKEESHRLAFERGSCLAMSLKSGCRYNEIPGFLEEKYGWLETSRVSSRMWRDLAEKIRTTRRLRNISTISLPPTGRSGLVVDASLGIEPIFSLVGHGVALHPFLTEIPRTTQRAIKTIMRSIKERGSLGHLEGLPKSLRNVFMTALEIAPDDHLRMVGHLQKAVDESISKTINLPQDASPANIKATYLKAHELGLKGVTVFRAGSRLLQPKKLAHL
jgi:ribonucleoside-diphosphate reductase alpha chain